MAVKDSDICIVGGGGHVGLPLALAFTAVGQRVVIYDLNVTALETIKTGSMPFVEHEAEPLLRSALDKRLLVLSSDPSDVSKAHHVIIAIGTPVDEYLNPQLRHTCLD